MRIGRAGRVYMLVLLFFIWSLEVRSRWVYMLVLLFFMRSMEVQMGAIVGVSRQGGCAWLLSWPGI
jgi:hypothetical protein